MQSLVIVKPDGVRRGLVGEIIMNLYATGHFLAHGKMIVLPEELAENLYREHEGKEFFKRITGFLSDQEPSMVMIWKGNPVDIRSHVLAIRAKYRNFASALHENVVHASDSEESAAREVDLFLHVIC